MEYLIVAQNVARSGQPYMNLASERYGGDIENMIRLGKPFPQYKQNLAHPIALSIELLGGLRWVSVDWEEFRRSLTWW